jgi:thiol-disulfide isomerase/thioredoxin
MSLIALLTFALIQPVGSEQAIPKVSNQEIPSLEFLFARKSSLKPLNFEAESADVKLKGAKATVVVLWASWCGYCRLQLSRLAALYQRENKNGLRIIAISLDKDLKAAKDEADLRKYPFAVYFDEEKIFKENMSVTKVPVAFILGDGPKPTSIYSGMTEERYANMRKRIMGMLETSEAEL